MNEYRRSNKALYIYIVFYVLSIIYFCSLLGNLRAKYILLLLVTIAIDFLEILIYIMIFTFKSFKFLITPAITSIIEIIFTHFYWNLTLEGTLYMSIVALILIIYIGFISSQCKLEFTKDEYVFAALIMNYLIFSFVAFIFYECFKNYIKVNFMKNRTHSR